MTFPLCPTATVQRPMYDCAVLLPLYAPTARASDDTRITRAEKLDRYDLRRLVKQPRDGFTLTGFTMETVAPIPYDVLKEGVVQ